MMASRRRRCVCLVVLLLSMHAPSEAARAQARSLLSGAAGAGAGGRSSATHFAEELGEVSGRGSVGSFKCPPGLKRHDDESQKLCLFDRGAQKFEDDELSDLWTRAGNAGPLLFEDAAFKLEPQFLAEFASAASDRSVMKGVFNEVAAIEVERDHGLKVRYEHWKHNLHESEENLKPGVFVLEHLAEHVALEGMIVGFEALAVAAEGAAVLTEEIVAASLLGALEGALSVTAGALSVVLHWVMPILLIPQTIYMIWRIRKHFKEITHHTKAFIMRLVFKSDCMEETTRMLRDGDEGELKSEIGEVCGKETERKLHAQIHRTNAAMEGIFTTLEEVGRCLWPHNHRAYAKIGCAERIYRPLRELHGHAGIVFLALSFAVAYAHFTDDSLEKPWYGNFLEKEFGIELPHTSKTSLGSLANESIEVRSIACMQLLATHRAFEQTFKRLRLGIQVWLQTYGRSYRSASIRHSWWPCRKVFNSIEHSDRGFCKHVDWAIGHKEEERSLAPQEEDPCHSKWHGEHTSLWPEVEEEAEKAAKEEEEMAQQELMADLVNEELAKELAKLGQIGTGMR